MPAPVMGTVWWDGEGRSLTPTLLAFMIQGAEEYLRTRNDIWKIVAFMRAGFRETPPAAK